MGTDDEADQVHGRADHRGSARTRGWSEDGRSSAQARHFGSHAVQLEGQIRRHGDFGRQASAVAGRREPQAEEALGGVDAGPGGAERASDKKMVGPAAKREAVAHLRNIVQMSERRACILVSADRKMIRYRSRRPPDVELRSRLRDLANQRRRFGYRRLFILLREQGEPSGINRIYRLYREEGLTVRKRKARRKGSVQNLSHI